MIENDLSPIIVQEKTTSTKFNVLPTPESQSEGTFGAAGAPPFLVWSRGVSSDFSKMVLRKFKKQCFHFNYPPGIPRVVHRKYAEMRRLRWIFGNTKCIRKRIRLRIHLELDRSAAFATQSVFRKSGRGNTESHAI